MSVVDLPQLITIADTCDYWPVQPKTGATTVTLSHDLTKISNITNRVPINGKSPRALTVVGGKAITVGYFDDNLELFDLALPGSGNKTQASGSIALGPEVTKTAQRTGEGLFYDANLCLQRWHTCHTCHPFTRPDGLNWTLNAEISAPKNTSSMLYSWWTPPNMWSGKRPNASEAIRAGMRSQLFLQPLPDTAALIDTFFMNIKPIPGARLVKGRLSASALRGRDVFCGGKAACVACHPGPLFTDKKSHAMGIADPYDPTVQWDTPTLVECWRTAPYGHLGSKLTIREMVEMPGMGGVAGKLTEGEIEDLVEFVLSL
jgi:cytochrome c peroxidase